MSGYMNSRGNVMVFREIYPLFSLSLCLCLCHCLFVGHVSPCVGTCENIQITNSQGNVMVFREIEPSHRSCDKIYSSCQRAATQDYFALLLRHTSCLFFKSLVYLALYISPQVFYLQKISHLDCSLLYTPIIQFIIHPDLCTAPLLSDISIFYNFITFLFLSDPGLLVRSMCLVLCN